MDHSNDRVGRRGLAVALSTLAAIGLCLCVEASAAPTFSLSAAPVTSGQPLVVDAIASGLSDLYGYQLSLRFDATRVQFVSATEGPFLAQGGTTFFDAGAADNAAGTVSFVFDTLLGALPGVSGSGELARFVFSTLRSGPADFALFDVLAVDSTLAPIDVQTAATSAVVPEPASGALLLLGATALAFTRTRSGRRARA